MLPIAVKSSLPEPSNIAGKSGFIVIARRPITVTENNRSAFATRSSGLRAETSANRDSMPKLCDMGQGLKGHAARKCLSTPALAVICAARPGDAPAASRERSDPVRIIFLPHRVRCLGLQTALCDRIVSDQNSCRQEILRATLEVFHLNTAWSALILGEYFADQAPAHELIFLRLLQFVRWFG